MNAGTALLQWLGSADGPGRRESGETAQVGVSMAECFATSLPPFHSDTPSRATPGLVKAGEPLSPPGGREGGPALCCELGNSCVTDYRLPLTLSHRVGFPL